MTLDLRRLEEPAGLLGALNAPTGRRAFLRRSGIAALGVGLVGCDDDPITPRGGGVTLDLATDVGVLNYAYALEQLEAAFYTQVVEEMYSGASSMEVQVMTDLRDHEIAHRELFKAALGGDAIPALAVDFGAVEFGDRQSVLATAQTFEDLGVAAYNGGGKYLSDPDLLTLAGKIVSVEARHASVIRTLRGNPFAPDAFDAAMEPADVLVAAGAFIETEITLRNA